VRAHPTANADYSTKINRCNLNRGATRRMEIPLYSEGLSRPGTTNHGTPASGESSVRQPCAAYESGSLGDTTRGWW
jgi:hypothetical protein